MAVFMSLDHLSIHLNNMSDSLDLKLPN